MHSPQALRRAASSTILIAIAAVVAAPPTAVRAGDPAKPVLTPQPAPPRESCSLLQMTHDWDFSLGRQGFHSFPCDASGIDIWEWGHSSIPGAPETVWGTIIQEDYPNEAGAGLRSPGFLVTEETGRVEVHHYFETEYGYDGCNVTVWPQGTVLEPVGGYSVPQVSSSGSYYAWCVDGEPGWTGSSGGWRVDCFDVSAWDGQEIAIELDFGSDASVTAAGWYVSRVRVGSSEPPSAVCCLGESCVIATQAACTDGIGTWHPEWESCEPNPCPSVYAACCLGDGSCQLLEEGDCLSLDGVWLSETSSCAPDPCAPPDIPTAPRNLLAETQSPSQIRLSWEDLSATEQLLFIDRKEGSTGTWQLAQILPGNSTTWEDITVQEGFAYIYRVRGQNSSGFSAYSNFAGAQAGPVPAAPTMVVATPLSPVRAALTWSDQAGNEVGYQVQRMVGEFGAWEDAGAALPANTSSVVMTGLQPTYRYTFRVRSYNLYGWSAWIASNNFFMPADPGNFLAAIHVARGAQSVANAKVYRIRGGADPVLIGNTDSGGNLVVPDLRLNDRIRAVWEAQKWQTCRDYTESIGDPDFGMRLLIDSDTRGPNAVCTAFLVETVATQYDLNLQHPVFHVDLALSLEWDEPANGIYWTNLATSIGLASNYLYDVTDGQVALGKIAVWDCKGWWGEADVQVESHLDRAHADAGQFLDCDCCSSEEHIAIGRNAHGGPPGAAWGRTLIHEWGHYGFNLKDEYETIGGGQDGMRKLKDDHPEIYPENYGAMDEQLLTTEMSSANDYVQNLQYDCVGMWPGLFCATEQLASRGMSCWDQLEGLLEGWSSLIDIQKPPYGWFANGAPTSADLTGPDDNVGLEWYAWGNQGSRAFPRPSIEIFDRGPGSRSAMMEVAQAGAAAADAVVYRLDRGSLIDVGRTDLRGRLLADGLRRGDAIRVYNRHPGGTTRLLGDPLAAASDGQARLRVVLSRGVRSEDQAPGAAIELTSPSAGGTAWCRLGLWADEPLAGPPTVVAFCSGRIDTLAVEALPGTEHYEALLTAVLADSLFDGTGTFEVGMEDLDANRTEFVVPFGLHDLEAGEDTELYQGQANINLSGASVSATGSAAAAAGNPWPFRVPGLEATPVGELFSIRLEPDDPFPAPGSINILYNDSLLAGIDERSLRIRRWDPSGPAWIPLGEGGVQTEANVVSARVDAGGTFCIFADDVTDDVVPPGGVGDLGAVGVPGSGLIRLLWTATGDDGASGTAEGYEIAYADSAFGADDWEALTVLPVAQTAEAGSELNVTVQLPQPGRLYYLALRAIDEASNRSEMSNLTYAISGVVDGNFLPAPPRDFRAVDNPDDDGGRVHLSWERSYDDGGGKNTVTGYWIYRGAPANLVPQVIAFQPPGAAAFVDSTAVNGQRYVYWVAATDDLSQSMAMENHAYSARNLEVPAADFSSDTIVGVNDLALLLEGYGTTEAELEFEPLLDLDEDGQVFSEDLELFAEEFGIGGLPYSDPPGENANAVLLRDEATDGGALWHLNVTIRGAVNLSGYSLGIDYPAGVLAFLGATADSDGVIPNILNEEGGVTPCFLVREVEPGHLVLANALQRSSAWIAPDGDGFIARISFLGSGLDAVDVRDVVLLDHEGGLNLHPVVTSVEDGATVLRPALHGAWPTPAGGPMTISFQVPSRRRVTLAVYDVSGRLARTILNSAVEPGRHAMEWDGLSSQRHPVASGVYFLRMETEGFEASRKIVRIR